MAGRILYILIGVTLTILVAYTASYGLDRESIEAYKLAMNMQSELGDIGFEGFDVSDFDVSFYAGNKDYVVHMNNGDVSVVKRKPVIDTFAGTIYDTGEAVQVIVPEYSKWDTFMSIANAAVDTNEFLHGQDVMSKDAEYGVRSLAATIWHEAFHAYQYTEFDFMDENEYMQEQELSEMVDENERAEELYIQELDCLATAINEKDVQKRNAVVEKYLSASKARKALLPEDAVKSEVFYTLIEGSAYYVEGQVYKAVNGKGLYEKNYIAASREYTDGNAKYYNLGMLQCSLLDVMDKDWKKGYNFTKDFETLISEKMD